MNGQQKVNKRQRDLLPPAVLLADSPAAWSAGPEHLESVGISRDVQAVFAKGLSRSGHAPAFAPGEFLGVGTDEEFAACSNAFQVLSILRRFYQDPTVNSLGCMSVRSFVGWFLAAGCPQSVAAWLMVTGSWGGPLEGGWRAYAAGLSPQEYRNTCPDTTTLHALAALLGNDRIRGLEAL